MTRTVKNHVFSIIENAIINGELSAKVAQVVTINGETNENDARKALAKKQKTGEVKSGFAILTAIEKVTYFMEDELFFKHAEAIEAHAEECAKFPEEGSTESTEEGSTEPTEENA